MTNLDLRDYKSLYLKTAREHLANLKKNMEMLNANPTDKKALYEVFRFFHSLKSQNLFMGYEKMGRLCKVFEDYFRQINDGEKKYKNEISGTITEVVVKLENSLDEIEKNNVEKDLTQDIINYQTSPLIL